MLAKSDSSEYRFEKQRVRALVLLANGESIDGHFFIASGTAHRSGPERIVDLLNTQAGFVPIEVHDPDPRHTNLYNRAHIVTVTLPSNDAQLEPGYEVATRCDVTLRLTTGARLEGTIRIYQPEGYGRLSDWTRQSEPFQYVEIGALTTIVNTSHILEISEVSAD
jgi:hypothetical protein